jgi:hypothetical protein
MWSSWDIDKHGIQIDFTDSQGVHRSATYVVVLTAVQIDPPHPPTPRLGDSVEFLCLQVFARGCAGAAVEQATGRGGIPPSLCSLSSPLLRIIRLLTPSSKKAGARTVRKRYDASCQRRLILPLPICRSVLARLVSCNEGHPISKRQGSMIAAVSIGHAPVHATSRSSAVTASGQPFAHRQTCSAGADLCRS